MTIVGVLVIILAGEGVGVEAVHTFVDFEHLVHITHRSINLLLQNLSFFFFTHFAIIKIINIVLVV